MLLDLRGPRLALTILQTRVYALDDAVFVLEPNADADPSTWE